MGREMQHNGRNQAQNMRKRKRASKRKRQRRKVILVLAVILLALGCLAFAFVWNKYDKMGKTLIKEKDVKINELTPYTKEALECY